DPWTRVKVRSVDEECDGGSIRTHIVGRVRQSRASLFGLVALTLGAGISAALGWSSAFFSLVLLTTAMTLLEAVAMVRAGRFFYRTIEACAAQLELTPLGTPVRSAGRVQANCAENTRLTPGNLAPVKLTAPNQAATK